MIRYRSPYSNYYEGTLKQFFETNSSKDEYEQYTFIHDHNFCMNIPDWIEKQELEISDAPDREKMEN